MSTAARTAHERWLRITGAAVAILAFAMGVFTLVLIVKEGQFGANDLASSLVAVTFAPVGGLIAVQRPRHAIGWVLLFVAFTQGVWRRAAHMPTRRCMCTPGCGREAP